MPALPLRLAAATTLLALAACAGTAEPAPRGAEAGPFAQEPAPPPAIDDPGNTDPGAAGEEPAMQCQSETLSWALGQVADEATVAKLQEQAKASRVRVIKPDMAVTMDYREDRLNIDVDDAGKIKRLHCG